MKRVIIMTIILLLIPLSCRTAAAQTPPDTSTALVERFAAGLALVEGAPVGSLALLTPVGSTWYNASTLLSSGSDGGIASQMFFMAYRGSRISIAIGTGAAADIVKKNPDFDHAVTYLSSATGIAISYHFNSVIFAHASALYTTPEPAGRKSRAYLLLSFPLRS